MTSLPAVFLFDLDGVLVQPAGYRAAIAATINHFTGALGLGELAPGEETIALFESQGMTNEWDIIPICLGTIFETILRAHPETDLPSDLDHLDGTHLPAPESVLDFETPIFHAGNLIQPGMSPSESLHQAGERGPFPYLARFRLFDSLFAHTQDLQKSAITRIFQNFVTGSAAFEQVYHLPAPMTTESYLKQFDHPLLERGVKEQVEALSRKKDLHLAVLSARPSLPPAGVDIPGPGYSPEAEQALELVGLDVIPLIGGGRLLYIAATRRVAFNLLLKPSPFQAIASILAAVSGNEREGLDAAFSMCQRMGLLPGIDQTSHDAGFGATGPLIKIGKDAFLPTFDGSLFIQSSGSGRPLPVHIFEDSPIGLQSVQQAGVLLNLTGFPVSIRSWGIATNPAKARALEAAGAGVYPDINQALRRILGD